jgi:hypothetical protein
MEKLCVFVMRKVHGEETWWLRRSFLVSKMRRNSPTCVCNFKKIPGLYPGASLKWGKGDMGREAGEGRGRGRRERGGGREGEVACLMTFRSVVPPQGGCAAPVFYSMASSLYQSSERSDKCFTGFYNSYAYFLLHLIQNRQISWTFIFNDGIAGLVHSG